VIKTFRRFYAEASDTPGELFAIWGSAGMLEIVALNSNAAQKLGARRGDTVRVHPGLDPEA
jgi:S-adenosylmethionine hydrolase